MRNALLFCIVLSAGLLNGQTTLRDAAAQRSLLMGAAADADEFGAPNRLDEPGYGPTLSSQYSLLEPENAMKWNPIHPAPTTYDFSSADKLVDFAAQYNMKVRGHNLAWYAFNPAWLGTLAQTANPAAMSAVLQDHITTVVTHYKGRVFAWDVVNEAISDSAGGNGIELRDSLWYNQPGIGLTGAGYIDQAFRWAHQADPNALLFYNEYSIEGNTPKFRSLMNLLKDLQARGTPINGVGFQMHIDTSGYPNNGDLAQNIQQVTALGLQVHITEMDVRLPVNTSGVASASDLQAQAATYQRILTVCLQNPGCTAFQTWGFTDKHSWIPSSYPGQGAALPFDLNYQAKPAVAAMISAMQSVAPTLKAANIVNAASYQGGAISPGEIVTIFQANYGPAALVGAQFDANHRLTSNLSGTQVFFDGVPAPFVYSWTGQSSVIVPYEAAGRQQTMVQYQYNGVSSNTVAVPVTAATPGVFAADATGGGPGLALHRDFTLVTPSSAVTAGDPVILLATGGGTVLGGAVDGAVAAAAGQQSLNVKATLGGLPAAVLYAGPAPSLVNGVLQVNLTVPAGLTAGPQPVVITVGGVASQSGITVDVK
jgi:endo-1,4-beta-xylanase